jgi:hypothetical protein
VIDWEKLSDSHLPSKSEYLKEFSQHWNWAEIARNSKITWTDALFAEYEDKLLPVLADIMFENLAADNDIHFPSIRKGYYYGRHSGLFEHLVRKDVSELQIEILSELFKEKKCDLNTLKSQKKLIDDLIESGIL